MNAYASEGPNNPNSWRFVMGSYLVVGLASVDGTEKWPSLC
jgi:hypothetical protein